MKYLAPVLTIVVFLGLQSTVAERIAIGSVAPDFVVVCVILFGLQRGPTQGALFGFAVGLLVDLGNPSYLGLNALTKTLVGYIGGRLRSAASPGALVLALVFFLAALVHDVVYFFVYLWPRVGSAVVSILTNGLPSALYTALTGILVERILALLGAKVVTTLGKERQ
jgi:rod shape-determining protein MreD